MACAKGKLHIVGVPSEGLSRFCNYSKDMDFDSEITVEESRITSSTYELTITKKTTVSNEKWNSDIEPFLKSYFGCLVSTKGVR